MGFFDHLYDSLTNNTQIQTSLKYGIGAATAISLTHFTVKGKPMRAIMLWIYVFVPMTMGTSFYLDYKRIKEKLMAQQFEAALKHKTLTAGTEDDMTGRTVRDIEDYFPSK